MTTQILTAPTGDGDAFSSQTTPLDGTAFVLDFAFNQRCACWYLSIATLDGTPVATVKLVCAWDLLRKCASPLRPPGKLFVLSTTGDSSPPGLTALAPGGRCILVYIPAANVEAFAASKGAP